MKTFIGGLIIGIVIMGVTFGLFYLGRQNAKKDSGLSVEVEQSENSDDDVKFEMVGTPVAVSIKDKVSVQANILTSVSTKTYESLIEDMADTVYVSLHASECCGDVSTNEAAENLKYLDNAQPPWLFDRTQTTLNSLSKTYPETMGDEFIIGISANNMVVSFGLNEENKINEIHIIPNADMLLL